MDWNQVLAKIKDFLDMRMAINDQYNAFWSEQIVFSWRWWFKIAMLILPWVLWAFIRKKDSTGRLLLAAMFIAAFSFLLDDIGYNLGLWFYTVRILPFVPTNSAYDLSALPIAAMLFIQFFPKIKPVYKALVFAGIGSVIALPILSWVGFYRNVNWSYIYSFPILFVEYWIAHRLTLLKSFEPANPVNKS